MEMLLQRIKFDGDSTLGLLDVGGWQCHTLEDKVRISKIFGATAIPKGRYEVIINWSNKFGKRLPLLLNVPHYEGVRFHSGNTIKDTLGCILLGREPRLINGNWEVYRSRVTFGEFFPLLEAALLKEKVWVTIS